MNTIKKVLSFNNAKNTKNCYWIFIKTSFFLIKKSLSCQGIFEIRKLKIALLGNDFNYSIVFYVEEMSMMLLLSQHKTLVAGKLLGFFFVAYIVKSFGHTKIIQKKN